MDLPTLDAALSKLEQSFETAFATSGKLIPIKNNTLRDALKNQVDLKLEYERFKAQADHYEKIAEAIKEQWHAHAFATIMAKSNKIYNGSDARKMADCDSDYIAAVKVYNKAYKLKRQIGAVHETITERNFTLKGITASINNGTADHII